MTTAEMNKVVFSPIARGRQFREVETTMQIVGDDQIEAVEADPKKFLFRILDQKDGDKRLVWDSTNMADIREARRMFNHFLGQGLTAYRVTPGGAKSTQSMNEFDPTAEEIIFMPITLIAGG